MTAPRAGRANGGQGRDQRGRIRAGGSGGADTTNVISCYGGRRCDVLVAVAVIILLGGADGAGKRAPHSLERRWRRRRRHLAVVHGCQIRYTGT